MSDGEEEEVGDEDREPCGDEGGRHWELWLGTADWGLCEGTWAELELLLLPIPFSVRNSSKSMYWSWKRLPSAAAMLRSQKIGPKSWLKFPPPFALPPPPFPRQLLLLLSPPLFLMAHTPRESSSRSSLSLSAREKREGSLLPPDWENSLDLLRNTYGLKTFLLKN